MRVYPNPSEYQTAQFNSFYHHSNIRPLKKLTIMSPLRNFRVKGLPSTEEILDLVSNKLKSFESMWTLGDGEDHYAGFLLVNYEPFGIGIFLTGTHQRGTSRVAPFIVVPSLSIYLHPDEVLGEAVSLLVRENCLGAGCGLDPGVEG